MSRPFNSYYLKHVRISRVPDTSDSSDLELNGCLIWLIGITHQQYIEGESVHIAQAIIVLTFMGARNKYDSNRISSGW